MTLKTFRTRTLAVAAVGALTLTGTALAAHPKSSHEVRWNDLGGQGQWHSAPTVTFKVSKDGKKLVNFTYQTVGCFAGAKGEQAGAWARSR